MSLTTLPDTVSADEVVEVIRRDGGVIIRDLFSPGLIAALMADLGPHLDSVSYGEDEAFLGKKTRRVSRLFGRSAHMAEIVLNPLYRGAAEKILLKPHQGWIGQELVTYLPSLQIGITQAIQIHPGEGVQPLHRDDTPFMWRHPEYGREARLQIMIAITDFTEANGATRIIPGSHRWDDTRMPLDEETVPAEMTAGSAALFIGSTFHGGGRNSTAAPRTGLTMALDLAHLRQEENQYLSVPLEMVRKYPAEVQRLLGWSAGENFSGWIELDGQLADPQVLLSDPAYDAGLPALS